MDVLADCPVKPISVIPIDNGSNPLLLTIYEKNKKDMKVKELIEELKNYNPEATLTVGDNFDNGLHISYSGGDGGTKSDALFVCLDKENITGNNENINF